MPLDNQNNPYTIIPPPVPPYYYPPSPLPPFQQLGCLPPLYPPLAIPGRRRGSKHPGVSVSIAPNQTVSGGLMFGNVNFIRGRIDVSGNSIIVRKRGSYIVTFDVTVSLVPPVPHTPVPPHPPAPTPTAVATFTLQPMGTTIANINVTSPTTQLLSGSQVIELYRDTYLSISDVLTNATVLSGTFSVSRISAGTSSSSSRYAEVIV
jgi:hypothetical protein